MSGEPNRSLVTLLEELDGLPGVRGSLVATVDGAYQASDRGAFDLATATDIAKTALETGQGVYDLVCDRGLMTREELDRALNPETMLGPE